MDYFGNIIPLDIFNKLKNRNLQNQSDRKSLIQCLQSNIDDLKLYKAAKTSEDGLYIKHKPSGQFLLIRHSDLKGYSSADIALLAEIENDESLGAKDFSIK